MKRKAIFYAAAAARRRRLLGACLAVLLLSGDAGVVALKDGILESNRQFLEGSSFKSDEAVQVRRGHSAKSGSDQVVLHSRETANIASFESSMQMHMAESTLDVDQGSKQLATSNTDVGIMKELATLLTIVFTLVGMVLNFLARFVAPTARLQGLKQSLKNAPHTSAVA